MNWRHLLAVALRDVADRLEPPTTDLPLLAWSAHRHAAALAAIAEIAQSN